MLDLDFIPKNYKTERRDSFLLALLLHILLLAICLLPLLDLSIKPKEPIKGIMVVFNQEDNLEQDKELPAAAASKSINVENKLSSSTAPKKIKIAEKPVETKPVKDIVIKKVEVNIKSESKSDESEVIIDKAKLKAEKEAKEAAKKAKEDAERLKSQKDRFGSLIGNSDSVNESSTESNKPSTSILEGNSSDSGNSAHAEGLGSRGILYKPNIEDDSNKEGRVIVKICVNQTGVVSSADFVQSGSTTTDTQLIQKALSGAKKYKFTVLEDQAKQCGNITIDFILK